MISGILHSSVKRKLFLKNSITLSRFHNRVDYSLSSIKPKVSKHSNGWLKYLIGIPLLSVIGLYQYTKYNFLRYTIPE